MGLEIERKFLANLSAVDKLPVGKSIRQGYISTGTAAVSRVRAKNRQGFLTIKGPIADDGVTRLEFEYEIPLADANQILDTLCSGRIVEKTRYEIQFEEHIWELDVFSGDNDGLIIAEVELKDPSEEISIPRWVVQEVSGDLRYANSRLAVCPFTSW